MTFCCRSRLKKDYDDFKRQPDHEKFTREQWTNEDGEANAGKEVSSALISESSEHMEFLKRDYTDAGRSLGLPRCVIAALICGFYFSHLRSLERGMC